MTTTTTTTPSPDDVILARRMFLAGCLGLPWLWICNSLYYRLCVFGPMMFVDYWPTSSSSKLVTVGGSNSSSSHHTDEQQQQQQLGEEEQSMQLKNKQELVKWVTRSTRGAFIIMSLFITWIVVFQLNKDTFFSPSWLVMDETDAELSGW